jgi:cathepsin D
MLFLINIFVALLALVFSASAAPVPKEAEPTITVPITRRRDSLTESESDIVDFRKVSNHLSHVSNKYTKTMANYEINTGKAHPLRKHHNNKSTERRSSGTVKLVDVDHGTLWHGAITLGGKTTQCDFDTGSADIIINPEGYTPGSSSKKTGNTFTASYGDGTTASGAVYTDTISVGGLKASGVSIGRSSSDFVSFAQEGDQGICGLSYPSLSVLGSGSTPFFDGLMNSKVLTKDVFTFTLASKGSTLHLGGVSPAGSSPVYTSVDPSEGYWTVSDSSINGIATASIVDTGTSLIVAPVAFAQSLFQAVGATTFSQDGTLFGSYDCKSAPTVTYKMGSFSQKLSASTMTIGKTSEGACILSVVGQDTGLNAVIAGDSFLANVHATFDRTNNQVGFTSQ